MKTLVLAILLASATANAHSRKQIAEPALFGTWNWHLFDGRKITGVTVGFVRHTSVVLLSLGQSKPQYQLDGSRDYHTILTMEGNWSLFHWEDQELHTGFTVGGGIGASILIDTSVQDYTIVHAKIPDITLDEEVHAQLVFLANIGPLQIVLKAVAGEKKARRVVLGIGGRW